MSNSAITINTNDPNAYHVGGTDVPVADGGTGVSSLTAYAPIFGGTTSTGAVQSGTVGTSGQVLTSNGAGALPTFQDASGGGGTMKFYMPPPAHQFNGAVGETTLTGNTSAWATSFVLPASITVDEIGLRVSGTTGTDGIVSIGIYSEDGQTKHIDVDTGTIGDANQNEYTAVSAVTLPAGRYWALFLANSTASIQINRYTVIGVSFANSGVEAMGKLTVTADTLPTTFTPSSVTFSNDTAIIFSLRDA